MNFVESKNGNCSCLFPSMLNKTMVNVRVNDLLVDKERTCYDVEQDDDHVTDIEYCRDPKLKFKDDLCDIEDAYEDVEGQKQRDERIVLDFEIYLEFSSLGIYSLLKQTVINAKVLNVVNAIKIIQVAGYLAEMAYDIDAVVSQVVDGPSDNDGSCK